MKKCSKCGDSKAKSEFSKKAASKDALRTQCKACVNAYSTLYALDPANKVKRVERRSAYRGKPDNKAKEKAYKAAYKADPKNKAREAAYISTRKVNDPLYKLVCNIRSLTYAAFSNNGFNKNTKTSKILGCSFEHLKQHLEAQFLDGMRWENQGTYWHIDHRIPISSACTEAEVIKLSHYSNLRPLHAELNRKKKDHMPYTILCHSEQDSSYIIKPFLEQDGTYILNKIARLRSRLIQHELQKEFAEADEKTLVLF